MSTALDIITASLQQTKVYAPGVPVSSSDAQAVLFELNLMLDEFSNETLAVFANVENSFTLVPGQIQYTIGAGGNINVTRPLALNAKPGSAYLVDANGNRFQMSIIEQDQYNQIGLLTQTSQLPDTIFYDPQYPLGIINIFPEPSIAYTVYFDSRLQLADMNSLTSVFSLPPGYLSMIRNNLSLRVWPLFKQGDPPGWLIEMARESKATVKRTNIKYSPSTMDVAIVSKAQSSYNIYNDSTNRADR